MRGSPPTDPLYRWHHVECRKCGEPQNVRVDQLHPETVKPGCCAANGGNHNDVHVSSDALLRPHLCGFCEGMKNGGPGGQRENEANMATMKKKKTNGAPLGVTTKGNGKGLATLGEAIQGKQKGKRPERVERGRHFEHLPVRVPDTEKLAAHKELSKLEGDRLALKSQKREVLARFREKFNALDVDIEKLVEKGNDGVEKRRVECVDYLLPTNEIETVRLDTNEVIERRAATGVELQESLGDYVSKDEGKKSGKGKKADAPAIEPPFGSLEIPGPPPSDAPAT